LGGEAGEQIRRTFIRSWEKDKESLGAVRLVERPHHGPAKKAGKGRPGPGEWSRAGRGGQKPATSPLGRYRIQQFCQGINKGTGVTFVKSVFIENWGEKILRRNF